VRVLRAGAALVVGTLLFGAGTASALSITFDLNFEFSNGTPPAGGTPWVTVTIDDAADAIGANGVRVTVSNVGLVGVEFVSEISLNLDPLLDPADLAETAVNTSAVGSFAVSFGADAFQADGDGKFDILVVLPPPPGAFSDKFTAGETISFDLDLGAPLSASDFDFGSAPGGGQGTFTAAAHVQGIGEDGEDSGWIGPVPEPSAALLLVLGLGGLVAFRSRRA
jgi:hypothetical protein